MPAYGFPGSGRHKALASGLLALLLAVAACCLLVAKAQADAGSSKPIVIGVAPSGGDDTQRLQAALDAASTAGPGAVIKLAAGTFHVGRPLIGLNFDGAIRGAGLRKTKVLADGSVNPDGLFQLVPPDEAAALRSFDYPVLFSFYESDVDRFGHPVGNRRSQGLVIEDLTLGARGRTVAHFDINENADTQRLFSLVWVFGYRPDWTNSQNQTPADTGEIDAEQAQVSTVRARFRRVHFAGRNHARAEHEPGGPFDPNPDVRNGFGIEGGLVVTQPDPDLVFFFRPINAALQCERCKFTDLPGQAGIFAPQLVGRNDPAWTFGQDAVAGRVNVTDSVFEDTAFGVIAGDISDVNVTVGSSVFRRTELGAWIEANFQSTEGDAIGYPASVPSRATISHSTLQDSDAAAVLVTEYSSPSLIDLKVSDNNFVLEAPSQAGVVGFTVEGARIVDNDFSGEGYAGVVAVTSAGWKIHDNDFCDLFVPPSAPNELGLPVNETQAPVVILDSVDIRVTDNDCA
jgi:hypothetical protein